VIVRSVIVIALLACACDREAAVPAPIRFLHTFGAEETELFNETVAERGLIVESSLVPFARGQQVIGDPCGYELPRSDPDDARGYRVAPERCASPELPGSTGPRAAAPSMIRRRRGPQSGRAGRREIATRRRAGSSIEERRGGACEPA
jgi:hypothetical protein